MSEAVWVYGWHAVKALLQKQPERVIRLLLQSGRDDQRAASIVELAKQHAIKVEQRAARDLDQLLSGARDQRKDQRRDQDKDQKESTHHNHQGVAAEVKPSNVLGEGELDRVLDSIEGPPLLLILDGVQDPHNLGACLRTADAAGVHAVIVPRDRAAGLSATVRKVACGAAETVPLIQVVNLSRTLKWLKDRGLWLIGTDDEASQPLYKANLKGPMGVVMGAEGSGMRRLTREHCDLLVSIPMSGVVESLNVSVATGVVLYEAVRQRSS
jgi:23S rRNA (guanosine2251-2'-O)-methyltransferase